MKDSILNSINLLCLFSSICLDILFILTIFSFFFIFLLIIITFRVHYNKSTILIIEIGIKILSHKTIFYFNAANFYHNKLNT